MADKKSYQLEALKVLADWTKCLVALETTTIGATLLFTKEHLGFYCGMTSALTIVTLLGVALLCYSIFWAVYLVFGIPDVIEQLSSAKEPSIDRKSTRLNSSHVSESRMPSSA